jgi:hypothetical protein
MPRRKLSGPALIDTIGLVEVIEILRLTPQGARVAADAPAPAEVEQPQLGFRINLGHGGGESSDYVTIEITSAVFGELLAEIAYAGSKVGRDFEYELMAMIARGADRARTEKPS